MADNTKKGKKRKWTEVSIDNPAFFSGDTEGFVSLEECHDYSLEFDQDSRVLKINEKTTEEKPKTEQTKKKKKRKKKKAKTAETVEEGKEEKSTEEKSIEENNDQNVDEGNKQL